MSTALASVRRLVARVLPEGAAILSVLIFGSYVMGLVRDRIFAQTFGAAAELDAYQSAFQLPELLFDVLVEAGLAAAFIPLFLRLRADDSGGAAADRFARTILTAAIGVMGVAALLMFIFAEATAGIVVPGYVVEGELTAQGELYVSLFRVMLATPILFAASLTLGQVLLVEQRFFWYGIAPLLYNGGIIVGTVAFSDSLGIFGPAIGAIIGALMHLASRFIGLWHSRFRIRLGWNARTSAIREFVRLTVPKMVSQPVEPITFSFFTQVASTLPFGSISVISYARNFQSVPVSLVGVAFAIAVFPALSTAYTKGDRPRFMQLLRSNLLSIGALTVMAAVALVVVAELAIRTLLGGGAFDAEDVALTSAVLAAFAISVPFESVAHLLSRGIYATRHTLMQAIASLVGLAVIVVSTRLLVGQLELIAIPVGFAIGQAAKVSLLAIALAVRLRAWRPPPE